MKWIDCKESMPDKSEVVIVWVKFQSLKRDWMESCINKNNEWEGVKKMQTVTHWMSITSPETMEN